MLKMGSFSLDLTRFKFAEKRVTMVHGFEGSETPINFRQNVGFCGSLQQKKFLKTSRKT